MGNDNRPQEIEYDIHISRKEIENPSLFQSRRTITYNMYKKWIFSMEYHDDLYGKYWKLEFYYDLCNHYWFNGDLSRFKVDDLVDFDYTIISNDEIRSYWISFIQASSSVKKDKEI